jgi:hypothetical protein
MDDLDLSIGCLMPGDACFRPALGLPLCLALIASYLRRPIPAGQVQLGGGRPGAVDPTAELLVIGGVGDGAAGR